MDKFLIALGAFLLLILLIIVFGGLSAIFTMWAWNLVLPSIFGITKITFLQAWGVNILIGLFTRVVRIKE